MRDEKVTCDGCGHDLTVTHNSVDYRLVLEAESKPGYGSGAYTDVMIYPALDRAHHFCGLQCLDRWRDHERHFDKLMGACWDTWKAEKGTVVGTVGINNRPMYSYPEPGAEVRKSWRAAARAAADEAHPVGKKA